MSDLTILTRPGAETSLSTGDLAAFAGRLRGELIPRGAPNYDDARRIWNAMVTRKPALIVRCRSGSDVVQAVRFAREHDLLVAVRGGGHNIAGNALADGGLCIDLSPMRSVRVDPGRRTARAEPGVTLGELDRDTQAFGLATPLGINSTTGIAGLTLGGGYGWLSRQHGLTIDNLLSADVVTADGELLTASDRENSDLFWAIRGGGGNFGVVTSFAYGLHRVGPMVLAGLIVHPFDRAAAVLRAYRDAVAQAPDSLTAWVVMRKAPPLPFLSPDVHGKEVVVIAVCYTGDPSQGERVLRPLRSIGRPHADVIAETPYVAFQTAFDPLLTAGARNYWKTHNFSGLQDGLIDTLVREVGRLPGPSCEIFLAHLGGAVSRHAEDSTAYAGRSAPFVMNVHARWDEVRNDDGCISWARAVHQATSGYAAGGAYVNFLTADEADRVHGAYGGNYDRLAAIKAKYDPNNVFRVNQNIIPRAAVPTAALPLRPAMPIAPRLDRGIEHGLS